MPLLGPASLRYSQRHLHGCATHGPSLSTLCAFCPFPSAVEDLAALYAGGSGLLV